MDEKQKQRLIELYPSHDIDKLEDYMVKRYGDKIANPLALAERIIEIDGNKFLKQLKNGGHIMDEFTELTIKQRVKLELTRQYIGKSSMTDDIVNSVNVLTENIFKNDSSVKTD